jgi:hypothetical protein
MKKKPHTVSDADLVEFLSGLHSSASPEFESYRKAWKLAEERYQQGKGFKSRFIAVATGTRFFLDLKRMVYTPVGQVTMNLLKEMGFPDYSTHSTQRTNVFNMPSLTRTATFFALVAPEPGEQGAYLNDAQADAFFKLLVNSHSVIKPNAKVISLKKP